MKLTMVSVQQRKPPFRDRVDYSRIVKGHKDSEGKMQPARRDEMLGSPDLEHANTSYMERLNLTMRMAMRQMSRKTNAFSKRAEHLGYHMDLFVTYYNWCRKHKTLKTTPAVAAGLAPWPYDIDWIVSLIEAGDSKPGSRGTYKKRSRGDASEMEV